MCAKRRGFTLIELLVVFTLVSVLVGIVLVSLNEARESSRDAVRISQAQEIQNALELYYLNNLQYPINNSGLHGEGNGYGGCPDGNWDDDDCGEFIPALYNNNVRGDADGIKYINRYRDPSGGDGINSVCGTGLWYNVDDPLVRQQYYLVIGVEGDPSDYDLPLCNIVNPGMLPCGNTHFCITP